MPPNKGSRPFLFQDKFTVEFGLRITARRARTSLIESVVCRFCEFWSREADEVEPQDGRKRKRTTEYKHWTNTFRSDNIRKHMVEQHSKRWAEYQAMRNNHEFTEENLKLFFKQSTVDASLERRSTVIVRRKVFTIDASIVDGIVKCSAMDFICDPWGY
jgi:hypothetical protein